jgi:hypothetical protein
LLLYAGIAIEVLHIFRNADWPNINIERERERKKENKASGSNAGTQQGGTETGGRVVVTHV